MIVTDNKPYLVRAINEWICDNLMTPYIYVETKYSGLVVPDNLFKESPLILNISPSACQSLCLSNDEITFQARFNGRISEIYIPMGAIIAILARENGQGMKFDVILKENINKSEGIKNNKIKKVSNLKIIK